MKKSQLMIAMVLLSACKVSSSGSQTLDAGASIDLMAQKPWNGSCLSATELGLSRDDVQVYLNAANAANAAGAAALFLSSNILLAKDNFFNLMPGDAATSFNGFKRGNIMAIACLQPKYAVDFVKGVHTTYCSATKDISSDINLTHGASPQAIESGGEDCSVMHSEGSLPM